MKNLTPLFRWIGGKQRVVPHLIHLVPTLCRDITYREPFLGAGSMFFRLQPETAVLGDVNSDLIGCYKRIRDKPDLISRYLRPWSGEFTNLRYLSARLEFNRLHDGFRKSSLFIVLNKTCFNGIWRVNRQGQFNVPFGRKYKPEIPSSGQLCRYSKRLQSVHFRCGDFLTQLTDAKEGDFVYLDPPYPPLNGTSFFTHYSANRFRMTDQDRVAKEFFRLTSLRCRVMVSNAAVSSILKLYKGSRVEIMPTTRYVGAGGVRHRASDVAILNYDESGSILNSRCHL
jgi:DNA adenine methylase